MYHLFRRFKRLFLITVCMITEMIHAVRSASGLSRIERIRSYSANTKRWGIALLKIFEIEVRVHGNLEEYQKTGGLFVSNHQSYLDILVHSAAVGVRFMPKSEIKSWPVLGKYVDTTCPIWVDRKNKQSAPEMDRQIRESIENRIPLIVYPEGSTSDGMSEFLPFKTAPFEPVAGTAYSVFPVLVVYRYGKNANPAWYGDQTLLPHLWKMLGNDPYPVDVYLLPGVSAQGKDRKMLAKELYAIMNTEYHRLRKEA